MPSSISKVQENRVRLFLSNMAYSLRYGHFWEKMALFLHFFHKVAISQLRNHNFSDKVTLFSSTLRDDKNIINLLAICMAYKLKNGHFLVKNGHFLYFTSNIPHSALGWGQFRKFFFWTFAFFYVRSWHFGILRFI